MKLYVGYPQRIKDDGFTVFKNENGEVTALSPEPSQKIIDHSPTGFCWGYGGSGPAQLALALLLDATGNAEDAKTYYQWFKWDFVAEWPMDNQWSILDIEIIRWLEDAKMRGLPVVGIPRAK